MKRLHLVGTSKDGKRLVFAQKKGAKFGSFEAPIGPKLLRLVDEHQQAKAAKQAPPRPQAVEEAPEAEEAAVLPIEPEETAGAEASELEAPVPIGLVAADQIDIPIPGSGRRPQAEEQPLPGIGGAPANHPSVLPQLEPPEIAKIERIRPRTEKPEIPARSKLTPAEIQGMIRAGRGIRSVANAAGTPLDWVRYLAEPIQEERKGIVRQMLTRRQERARLGMSGTTIGESIYENLRARGIRSPDDVIEEGFTAFRPDGREWTVRLVFDHRGRRQTASWRFDVQTREVTPLNSLATSLGWRRAGTADGENGAATPRPRRAPSRSRARPKSTGRKRTTTRRKTSSSKSTAARTKRRRSR